MMIFLRLCFLFWISFLAHAEEKASRFLVLNIDSSINPATLSYLTAGYTKAKSEHFDYVLITLNTPGGLVSTTKKILSLIGESPIPTIVWVFPEGGSATSAGAFLAAASHVVVMASGTNIGAATPINPSGDLGDLRSKAINDLTALMQSFAQIRGRNAEGYAKMIKDAASFTAQDALKQKLVDGIIDKHWDVCTFIQGRSVQLLGSKTTLVCNSPEFEYYHMDTGQELLNILADPNLSYILMMAGMALLYIEVQMGGTLIAGITGAILLLLAGIGFQVLPLNFGSLGLILFGFLLFLLEFFIPSYGTLTIGGLVALAMGSLFLYSNEDGYVAVSHQIIATVLAAITLFIATMGYFLLRNRRRDSPESTYNSLKGKKAIIVHKLDAKMGDLQGYQIKVGGEIWNAKSSNMDFKSGDSCEVLDDADESMTLTI